MSSYEKVVIVREPALRFANPARRLSHGFLVLKVQNLWEHGGIGKAAQVFGDRLTPLMSELTEVLAA